MFITLDYASDIPLYQQLRDAIVLGLARGELKPGDDLPSVRQLAADLGINMHTVNRAYEMLKQDGLLALLRGRGARLTTPDPAGLPVFARRLGTTLAPLAAEARCRAMGEADFLDLCTQQFRMVKGS